MFSLALLFVGLNSILLIIRLNSNINYKYMVQDLTVSKCL